MWEVTKDVVDEFIDLSLNYRQSGHPGGSRSKVHLLLALLLSGAMHHDLLQPWRPFGDRFILSAGHTVPLIYATLATLNEAMRVRHERTSDKRFAFPFEGRFALTWEDLLGLRRHGGLPGHAEMAGKTLFLKWNTGPSGHGMPPTVGQAVALKIAGAEEVKVFAVESAPAPCAVAVGGDAPRPAEALASLRRSLHPVGRPHRAPHLRDAGDAQ